MVGFIFLHRDILAWEWYQKPEVFRLFIHLLLKVNYTDKKWQGVDVKRGQLITSTAHLTSELKLSQQQIRTALKKLDSSGYITRQPTNRFTLITVVNYDKMQSIDDASNKPNIPQTTNKQLSNNKQLTTTKESNNKKNRNNIKIEERKKNFKKRVFEHSHYSDKILNDFFNYWSEVNLNKKQMRSEVDEFFEVGKRLKKWAQNERRPNFQSELGKKLLTNR
ncbi:hypothetical protein L3X39_13265 [Sabulilitoribacter multivorans]|uniref:Helix-turn-helix domain-containing protein n=1 Tax=Flaviramulus multivorans TaxID=1304750 RepID=A0ABS9ILY8_9FLAO|nr:hypothetical protein [Flaviramulus multivorans]MCF7561610.1 hypothetical protein [Flaviramulus multivorans]